MPSVLPGYVIACRPVYNLMRRSLVVLLPDPFFTAALFSSPDGFLRTPPIDRIPCQLDWQILLENYPIGIAFLFSI